MAATTTIEWTDATWNALRGCSKVSAGCTNCYAVGMAARFSGHGLWGHGIAERTCGGPRWTGAVVLDEKALTAPLRWKKPRRVFVTSIGDPFHPAVTDEMLDRLFAVMALCPQHTFQLLTKRPERMREYLSRVYDLLGPVWTVNHMREKPLKNGSHPVRQISQPTPLPNVWLGVSAENQAAADERIPHLLATPAAVRFLSCEPLLGPVDLGPWLDKPWCPTHDFAGGFCIQDCGDWRRINWVICGGESGPKARPMHPDWVRSLRDQCAAASVPFLFKQWGEWAHAEFIHELDGRRFREMEEYVEPTNGMYRVGKKIAGRLLDCREHLALPPR